MKNCALKVAKIMFPSRLFQTVCIFINSLEVSISIIRNKNQSNKVIYWNCDTPTL